MKKLMILVVVVLLSVANVAWASVEIQFDFFDASSILIGDGYYNFDEIAPGTKSPFASLTNFSWGFNLPTYGLFLSSSEGDVPSTDSLVDEGVLLSGTPGSRTLTFFDDRAVNILHQDVSRPFPIGVQFKDTDPSLAQYIVSTNGNDWITGTFAAYEVPEPMTISLLALGGLMLRRRRA